MPETLVRNIDWVRIFQEPESLYPLTMLEIKAVRARLEPMVADAEAPLRRLASTVDVELRLRPGSSLGVVQHLIGLQQWVVDMNFPINTEKALRVLSFR